MYSKVWRCALDPSVIYDAFVIRNFVVPCVEDHSVTRFQVEIIFAVLLGGDIIRHATSWGGNMLVMY